MVYRIDHGAGGLKKRIQPGILFIAVSLLFCASASAAEPQSNLPNKPNPDPHKAPSSAAESAAERERDLRHKHKPGQHKTPDSAAERERKLGKKHPDQYKNVTDTGWHTLYYEPGDTRFYITCNGVAPNQQNGLKISCKTSAVWAACTPHGPGGYAPATYCDCISHATEQHSGQYQISNCK